MNQPDYKQESFQNEATLKEVVRTIRPDVFSLMDKLDTFGLNYIVLLKIMDHLQKIAEGTKFGTVSIEIQDNVVTFVRSLESSRLNEGVLKS